ncbi:MAG: DoxX family protein [Polyangiales bacterium]
MSPLQLTGLWVLALTMVAIGVLHFAQPKPFVRIVPKFLPAPLALVYISGFFEILGGLGLLIPATRHWAAWGLIALYIAVFPANVYMLSHNISLNPKKPIPRWALWLRLPFQLLFIAWAYWFTG